MNLYTKKESHAIERAKRVQKDIDYRIKNKWNKDGELLVIDGNINFEDWADMEGHLLNYGLLLGGRYHISEKMSLVGTYYWALDEFWDDTDLASRSFQLYIKF